MSRIMKIVVLPAVVLGGLMFVAAPKAEAQWGFSFNSGPSYAAMPYGGYGGGYGMGSYYAPSYGFYGTSGYFPYNSFRTNYGGVSPFGYGGYHHHGGCRW